MKHTHKITYILVALFFFSQVIGIYIIGKNIDVVQVINPGTGAVLRNITYVDTPYLETMQVEDESVSYLPIFISIIIGTVIGLLLARFNRTGIWKVWFLMAVIITLYKSFSVFIPAIIAIAAAAVLGIWKIFRPNFYIHNFTELFIYAGIASIFVPILNVMSATILLILIAIYDAFAVWKSKHMITLAKFQSKVVFAGLSLQYDSKKDRLVHPRGNIGARSPKAEAGMRVPRPTDDIVKKQAQHPHSAVKTAILGGGDIAFPLLFGGAVMKGLLLVDTFPIAFLKTLMISIFATIALYLLFVYAKKDTFYPAMPFIAAGCFAGYGLVSIL